MKTRAALFSTILGTALVLSSPLVKAQPAMFVDFGAMDDSVAVRLENLARQYESSGHRILVSFSLLVQAQRIVTKPDMQKFMRESKLEKSFETVKRFFASNSFDDPANSLAVLEADLRPSSAKVCHKRANDFGHTVTCEQWSKAEVLALASALVAMDKVTKEFVKQMALLKEPEAKYRRLKVVINDDAVILDEAIRKEQAVLLNELLKADVLDSVVKREANLGGEIKSWVDESNKRSRLALELIGKTPDSSASIRLNDLVISTDKLAETKAAIRSQDLQGYSKLHPNAARLFGAIDESRVAESAKPTPMINAVSQAVANSAFMAVQKKY